MVQGRVKLRVRVKVRGQPTGIALCGCDMQWCMCACHLNEGQNQVHDDMLRLMNTASPPQIETIESISLFPIRCSLFLIRLVTVAPAESFGFAPAFRSSRMPSLFRFREAMWRGV